MQPVLEADYSSDASPSRRRGGDAPAGRPVYMDEYAYRMKRRLEIPVLVAALAVIPVVIIEEQSTSVTWMSAAYVVNWLIWGMFLFEYLLMMRLVDDRRAYSRNAWLDILVIVLSFPALPALLASTRLFRLVRLGPALQMLRLVKIAAVLTRAGSVTRRILGKRGVGYLAAVTILLALAFGSIIAIVEPAVASPLDGIWWALVTVTTVGYGDIAPVTTTGRFLAIGLMIVGIGFVAVLTAAVAAHLVEEDEAELEAEVARLHRRLDDIEALLRSRLR